MSARPPLDPARFVREQTRLLPVPHAPEILLHVADHATVLWQKTEEELGEMGLPPPFWAFAWAGGQGIARYVLDNPGIVSGKRVLDFASGSGLVAIAAAKAGATSVVAADIDIFAGAAVIANSEANGVQDRITAVTTDLVGTDDGWGAVLAGDIFYEKETAARVLAWLEALHARGAMVLIGDPGRSYLPRERLEEVATYRVATTRELEDSEVKATSVWRLRG
jgi:predicted nicotinamide N-methyase